MKKNLYSLTLSDEVVREVDALAHRLGTNRSALVNRILSEYVSVPTPERRINDIFEAIEALVSPSRELVPFFAPNSQSMSLKSSLAYKYRPTVKYEVDLGGGEDTLGTLNVVFRTQSAELIAAPDKAAGKAARYAGLVMTMAFLVVDLREHVALAEESVGRMSEMMQAIFPLMVTLLAAVGGTASSAFYQPAVMAAAGSMTTLISHVTLPFAVSVAVLTMVGSLSDGLRISRLRRLLRQVAEWTLGFGFTVFIGVMTVQGVSAAAVDGVSIRTAKYAMDNFIPIVGGMFADTVDTLVGCSLIVQNAVGALGLILLLGALAAPLLRTVVTMFLYRAASAFLQPIGDSPLARGMGDYAEVFSLLFIIQLSVGAMFLLLVAQLLTVANLTVMLR